MMFALRSSRSYLLKNASIVAVAMLFFSAPSSAQTRNGFTYNLSAASVYDSNPLTRSDDLLIEDIIGVETTASVIFKREAAKQAFNAEMALIRNQFNVSEFNSNDASLTVRARKEIKRWFLNITGEIERDTTRATSVDTRGQDNTRAGERTTWSISPSIIYGYSPLNSIGLNMNWTERAYEDNDFLTDYRTYSLSPFFSRAISPRQTAILAFQYQHYNSQSGPNVEVDSVGPFLTWKYKLKRNLFFEASLGLLSTRYDGLGVNDSWETNPIYSMIFEYEGQRNTSALSVRRARQALSNGAEIDTITTEIQNQYAISPRWNLDSGIEYTQADQSEFSNDNLDTRYGGSIGTTYEISRKIRFSASYQYLNENFTDDSSAATRNIIRAGIDYSLN